MTFGLWQVGALPGITSHILRYEDLLQADGGAAAIGNIAKAFCLPWAMCNSEVQTCFKLRRKSTKGGDSKFEDYVKLYLEGGWMDQYRPEDLRFVAGHLDGDLLRSLYYEPVAI